MKLQKRGSWQSLMLGTLGVCGMSVACKDDDPCDPGQIVQNSQCYPAPASGGETGKSGAGGEPEAAGAAASGAMNTPFGTACEDTTASSDCGGDAPLCADLGKLGQSVMCTQSDCSAGEANADVCPADFTCFAFPGYPSVCTKG